MVVSWTPVGCYVVGKFWGVLMFYDHINFISSLYRGHIFWALSEFLHFIIEVELKLVDGTHQTLIAEHFKIYLVFFISRNKKGFFFFFSWIDVNTKNSINNKDNQFHTLWQPSLWHKGHTFTITYPVLIVNNFIAIRQKGRAAHFKSREALSFHQMYFLEGCSVDNQRTLDKKVWEPALAFPTQLQH